MPNLFELTNERLALQNKLQELDFDTQTIVDTLEGDSTELQTKIENYGFVIRNMESFVESVKGEKQRLAEREEVYQARLDRIKEWLFKNMVACNFTKVECPAFTLSVQNNPPSVVIDAAGQIPGEFYVYPAAPEPYPDKKAIAKAIKDGAIVNGAHLEQTQRLVIK